MACDICGEARACDACRFEGHLRRRVGEDPAIRAEVERRWRGVPLRAESAASPAPGPPRPSPKALRLAQGCDHRGPVCQLGCVERRICGAGMGAVALSDCLACVADPSRPGGPAHDFA